ncbi:protein kinase [Streptomyces sp. NPDC059378]|uniref:serine/threonine protein kinase n=1 Tax=Streptomyces sp. NPDC059378 TaxID=3346815 RepID=UPI0036B4C69B
MGEVFAGRYELVDPIGRGGVGAVWRAWDHRRRRYVAAKVLQQSDAHSLLRFVREQAMRIDHPHVLAPASWAADDDKVLFTMDLVAGGSLVHLIGDYGPLPPAFVCTLIDQLLAGLAAVHTEGVVHRDIKPANVLLEATGTARPRLRLSDFGIAMRLGEPRLTETNLVVGTPGYLAPEQLMGAEPDFAADLFAVGLVTLYLLEGAKPDAKALVQYFAAHGTPGAPEGIPEPLWQVVAMLLQPDPQARFRTATGARKALGAAAELLPEPGLDDDLIEIFDQLGPLPAGFGPDGPLGPAPSPGPRPPRPASAAPADPGTSLDPGTIPDPSRASDPSRTPDTPAAPDRNTATGPAGGAPDSGHSTGTTVRAAGPGTAPTDPRLSPSLASSTPYPAPTAPAPTASPAPPAPAPAPSPSAARPAPAPAPEHPSASLPAHAAAPAPSRPASMSDTGSFHLPPPRTPTSEAPAPRHLVPASPDEPTYTPPAPPLPVSRPQPGHADASTASYTAEVPRTPPTARETARHRARRRPGPPARVAVPLLLLALACYAVGFWALARV